MVAITRTDDQRYQVTLLNPDVFEGTGELFFGAFRRARGEQLAGMTATDFQSPRHTVATGKMCALDAASD